MSQCELFHGTSSKFLDGIAERGLLPPEKSPQCNYAISAFGVVCATDSSWEAESWGMAPVRTFGGELVVLCLDAVERITAFDRNLCSDGQTIRGWMYGYEIPDGVPPERIRIHSRSPYYGECVPLRRG